MNPYKPWILMQGGIACLTRAAYRKHCQSMVIFGLIGRTCIAAFVFEIVMLKLCSVVWSVFSQAVGPQFDTWERNVSLSWFYVATSSYGTATNPSTTVQHQGRPSLEPVPGPFMPSAPPAPIALGVQTSYLWLHLQFTTSQSKPTA